MKKKVGTVLDEQILTAAKILAAKERKKLSQVIEEALIEYLRRRHGGGVVAKTQGALPASPEVVRAILEEEGEVFEG